MRGATGRPKAGAFHGTLLRAEQGLGAAGTFFGCMGTWRPGNGGEAAGPRRATGAARREKPLNGTTLDAAAGHWIRKPWSRRTSRGHPNPEDGVARRLGSPRGSKRLRGEVAMRDKTPAGGALAYPHGRGRGRSEGTLRRRARTEGRTGVIGRPRMRRGTSNQVRARQTPWAATLAGCSFRPRSTS